jgi:hypothetical protein
MHHMLYYLRIAVTALSLTACVLLIALWVRSYNTRDHVIGRIAETRFLSFVSLEGVLNMLTSNLPDSPRSPYRERWQLGSTNLDAWDKTEFVEVGVFGFYLAALPSNKSFIVCAPHWFLILLSAALAAAPWVPWSKRFSLRTLLIATTLVAIGLGAVIYLAR